VDRHIPNWHEYFFSIVKEAASRSKDKSVQVGCVVVGPDNEIRSTGYNGFPRGIDDSKKERYERPLKYRYTGHAEANSIAQAARVGTPLKDCTIYIPGLPCCNCTIAIIQAGIKHIVYDEDNWKKWIAAYNSEHICLTSQNKPDFYDVCVTGHKTYQDIVFTDQYYHSFQIDEKAPQWIKELPDALTMMYEADILLTPYKK
jgi:dCMP deaminase